MSNWLSRASSVNFTAHAKTQLGCCQEKVHGERIGCHKQSPPYERNILSKFWVQKVLLHRHIYVYI